MPTTFTQSADRDRTLFERMQRGTQQPTAERETADIPGFVGWNTGEQRGLVIIDVAPAAADGAVRFTRGNLDGAPAVNMQERLEDGSWHDSWSLPTDSVDAREGMMGWLNTQSHRWDRFARMFHRRGGKELTRWIFELMVVPTTAQARAPRFSPQQATTIHQYARPHVGTLSAARVRSVPRDDCGCRPSSLQTHNY